jgi:hypothetical protein
MSIDQDENAKDEEAEHPAAPPAEKPVGYKQPPVAHQFKKGVCPNPRGRPRKAERSYTPRQSRRDILRIGNTPTVINTEKGIKKITLFEAVLLRVASKALAGHGPSIRYFLKEYSEAQHEHNVVHHRYFQSLESLEIEFVLNPKGVDGKLGQMDLDSLRRLTRRT